MLPRVWSRLSTQSMRESEGSHNSYDVLILGGGPAGTATALALKRLDSSLRIALIEKGDYSGPRIGETLPPRAQAVLRGLGVWDAFIATSPVVSYGTRAGWGSATPHDNEFIFSRYGNGWHVDRNAFDAMLTAEAASAGVDVQLNTTPCGQPRYDRHWTMPVKSTSSSYELTSRFIVDATGRQSWFASRLGVRHQVHDQLAAIFAFYRFDPGSTHIDNYALIEASQNGWWYSAMLPDSRLAVAFMADVPHLRQIPWRNPEEWRLLAAKTSKTKERLDKAILSGKPSLCSAASQRLEYPAGEGWLAAGDAAGTFDPLSSQGIIKGLHSGICAARSICRYLHGGKSALADYADFIDREYSKYLEARRAYYRMEQRWPDSPFWQQRHEAVQSGAERQEHLQRSPDAGSARAIPRPLEERPRLFQDLSEVPRKANETVAELRNRTAGTDDCIPGIGS